ncbi:MAG: hypothetical protein HY905_19585 [Deltaproteobacteria bacterium]|nr:hypothetical protein [Deltaproteobacteria bacterium]
MALEREQAWFEQHRKELIEHHAGKWIAVHGETLIGVYDDFATAYAEGVQKTKSEEILVRLVTTEDRSASAPANCVGVLNASVYVS